MAYFLAKNDLELSLFNSYGPLAGNLSFSKFIPNFVGKPTVRTDVSSLSIILSLNSEGVVYTMLVIFIIFFNYFIKLIKNLGIGE